MVAFMRLVALLLLVLLFVSACGDATDEPPSDTGLSSAQNDAGMGSGSAAFGEACAQDSDCTSATCRHFEMLGDVCTALCTDNAACPSGTMGQKCNMNGFCRP
jgi:hypothetical protein